MAAVASPPHSPSSPHSPNMSSHRSQQQEPPARSSPLPPLNTSQTSRRTALQRPPSYAKSRMSTYSTTSRFSERGSRPISQAFPLFHSSLTFALVRDFAYPVAHPNHYGPPPAASEPTTAPSTPSSERNRRMSDPAATNWDRENGPWKGEAYFSTQQLPQLAYGDGPPYSEDEDLHSPVVKSSRHKRNKSSHPDMGPQSGGPNSDLNDGARGYVIRVNQDGSKTYIPRDEDESDDGPGDDLVTYPPDDIGRLAPDRYGPGNAHQRRNMSNRVRTGEDVEDSEDDSLGLPDRDDSRYSRDYQFTIASPDEEMHGKAVALFDFERENENELPLTEGQIIWVSYRHGQGWLVAEDPKTQDTGLVPEEYVRLLRDIQGGLGSLGAEEDQIESGETSPPEGVPDQSPVRPEHTRTTSNSHGEKNPAVVSSFSTSSKDLDPYPQHLMGDKAGQPPQVVHYASQSQSNTPTLRSPSGGTHGPRNFEEVKEASSDESTDSEKVKGKKGS